MNAAPPLSSQTSKLSSRPVAKRGWSLRRVLPSKIADGYLFETMLEGARDGVAMFAGLLFAFAIITAVRKLTDQTVTFAGAVQIMLLQMPRLILFTLPMSLLYACVKGFGELSARGELTALSVGGMSLGRMMRAPMAMGLAFCLLAFWLQEGAVPRAEQGRLVVLRDEALRATGVQADFELSRKRPDGTQIVINARELNFRTRVLTQPVIKLLNPDGSLSFQITAERAEWILPGEGERVGKWNFFNGRTQQLLNVLPTENQAPYRGGTFASTVVTYVPDPAELGNATKSLRENLESKNFEMVSMAELSAYREELQAREASTEKERQKRARTVRAATFGIHDKISTPLVCLSLVLVGCPLGLRKQRATGGFAMGLSLVVLLGYYVFWTWASSMGKAGYPAPLLWAYLPFVATTLVGLVLLRKRAT